MTAVMENLVADHPGEGTRVDFGEGPAEKGVLVSQLDIERGRRAVGNFVPAKVFARLVVVPRPIRSLRANWWPEERTVV